MGKLKDQLKGSRPAHMHRNKDGDEWQCNSPYCEDVNDSRDEHPDDGGPKPYFHERPRG